MTAGPLRCLAPAKINLTLRVLGRRPDGFHELDSIVVFAAFGDEVELRLGKPVRVETTGPFGQAIVGENLLERALDVLARVSPPLALGTVVLDKRLPVAAGLGGGSADVAALLRLVRKANRDATVNWDGIALGLGSDVPVCLQSRACRMSGRGETVEAIAGFPRLSAVLINPQVPVPADKTRQVFRRLGANALSTAPPTSRGPWPDRDEDWLALLAASGNDLEAAAAAVVPEAAEVLALVGADPDARIMRLSGSGPTCVAVTAHDDAASALAERIVRAHPEWWVLATMLA